MKSNTWNRAAVSIAVILFCAGIAAQATEPEQGDAHAGESHADGHLHLNEVVLFLGVTDEGGHDSQGTIGFEYLRLFGKRWGMGGLVDYAGGNQRNAIVAVPFVWIPVGHLKLIAALGIEWHDGRGEAESDGHGEVDEDRTEFLLRLGIAYDFRLSEQWRLGPTVDVDFVDGHQVWVYGANLSYAW